MTHQTNQENTAEILTNYKIPRRAPEMGKVQNYTTPLNWGPPIMNIDTPGAPKRLAQPVMTTISAPPVYNNNVKPTLNVTNKRPLEVPKNIKSNNREYRETCPYMSDATLPKELTALFQPLYCKLCLTHLNSNVNAMLHYKSKNHEKKVRKFLTEHSERTGEPLHKRAKVKTEPKKNDPKDLYCEVCDLQLTSKMHAEQHYMGRNHQKAMATKKPAGNCYLGDDGKWHRVGKPKEDVTGRNGIGLAFAKPEEFISKGKFYCNVCNISTTSDEHLDMHYNGQKHQKMLKKLGGKVPETPNIEETKIGPWEPIESSVSSDRKGVSSCRTPSGQYYCQPCNLTLNSEAQFMQHLDSKKHLRNKVKKT